MTKTICFDCRHFKQYQPLHYVTPGVCGWEPKGAVPHWVQAWLDMDCRYYGPAKDVSNNWPVLHCEAFEGKTDDKT